MPHFDYLTTVYVEDTDYSGAVYHANYLKFAERARTQWLQHVHFPLIDLAKQGLHFVVHAAHIDYLKPAQLNNQLLIRSTVSEHRKTSMTMAQIIQNPDDAKLIYAKLSIRLVCIDNDWRPQPIPHQLIEDLHRDS